MGWLTLGTTASSSSSGTCTTLTAMVHWTRTTSNAWPFVTPSLKARASGMRPLPRRTKRSWLTCGTRSLSWLILTRTMKSALKNLKRLFRPTAKAKHSLICLQPSKPFDTYFRTIDVDGDGTVGLTEFRVDCVNRMAYKSIGELDAAYEKLLNDDDKKAGGITLARYQELYAQFIGNPDEGCPAVNLFGPLSVIE